MSQEGKLYQIVGAQSLQWLRQRSVSIDKPQNIHRLVGLIRAKHDEKIFAIPIESWLGFLINGNPDLREKLLL